MPLIALEGGEGVGKSTQLRFLRERLPDLFPDRQFIFTREPGGTPLAERVRDLILSRDSNDADGKTLFSLFAAARFDHVKRLIRPALEAGKIVITDRFLGSSYAYQVVAQESPMSESFFTNYVNELQMFPHLTLVLTMEPQRSQERLKRRATDQSNHFDERDLQFHERLSSGYARFVDRYRGYNVVTIDADRSAEEVYSDISTHISKIIV